MRIVLSSTFQLITIEKLIKSYYFVWRLWTSVLTVSGEREYWEASPRSEQRSGPAQLLQYIWREPIPASHDYRCSAWIDEDALEKVLLFPKDVECAGLVSHVRSLRWIHTIGEDLHETKKSWCKAQGQHNTNVCLIKDNENDLYFATKITGGTLILFRSPIATPWNWHLRLTVLSFFVSVVSCLGKNR